MGDTGVAPDGKDKALGILQLLLGDEAVDFLVRPPDSQRGAVSLYQYLILHLVRLEKLDGTGHDLAGALADCPYTFGLVGVLGGASGVNQRYIKVAMDLDVFQLLVQCVEQCPGAAPVSISVETYLTTHIQVGEYPAIQFDVGSQWVASLAKDADKVVFVQAHGGEAAGGSSLSFHR